MRSRRAALQLLLVIGIVGVAVAGVTAPAVGAEGQVIGRPHLELFSPEAEVVPGEETTLEVFVANDGQLVRGGPAEYVDRVTTARATTLTPQSSSAPFQVRTGRIPVGSVAEGTRGPFVLTVEVPEDAPPGTYDLPIRVRYTYTRIVSYDDDSVSYGDASADSVQSIPVTVVDRARFAVEEAAADVSVGGSGTITLALTNVGTEVARDATVTVESSDPDLRFGGGAANARTHVGEWAVDDRQTLTFKVAVDESALARSTAITVTVDFQDAAGIRRTSPELTAGITPAPEQTFALRGVRSDLRVGEDGQVEGTLVNRGPRAAEDVVLVLESAGGGVLPDQTEYPVGQLAVNGSASFAFPVTVSNATRPGPRRLSLVADYAAADGSRIRSDTLGAAVDVRRARDEFRVEPLNATFPVDSDNTLVVRVTNRGNETLSEIEARLSVSDPLESDDPSAYLASLEPGESDVLTFQLTATDDALPKVHPTTVAFTYETALGTRRVSEPYPVPVTVVAQEGVDTTTIAIGGAVAALGLAIVWWRWRR